MPSFGMLSQWWSGMIFYKNKYLLVELTDLVMVYCECQNKFSVRLRVRK